jgi:hypothetical protein
MENCAFTGASLSDVIVIMVIMHVLSVELLCQAVMGRVPVFECLLLVEHGCHRLLPVLSDIKWPRSLRDLALPSRVWYREPLGVATGGTDVC